MHADSGRSREGNRGRGNEREGGGGGNDETVLAAVCRLTYVQGVNASEPVNVFTARTKTHPPRGSREKGSDKKGWESFEHTVRCVFVVQLKRFGGCHCVESVI